MVIGDGANCVVQVEVIFERSIVSPPGDSVVGRILGLGLENFADVLVNDLRNLYYLRSSLPSCLRTRHEGNGSPSG